MVGTCDPSISQLDIYPREENTYVHAKICTQVFIPALFVIASKVETITCSATGEWVNKCRISKPWKAIQQ